MSGDSIIVANQAWIENVDYSVNNDYVGGHENKGMIWYIYKFIYLYLLIERCMFRWIQMIAEESDQYKGYEK